MFNPASFKRYFANTSWLLAENVVNRVIAFVISIAIARYLGPEQFGLLNYALSFVGLFAMLATLGIDDVIVRELVRDEGRRDALLGTTCVMKLAGAIATIALVVVCAEVWATSDAQALMLVIALGTIFQPLHVIELYFRAVVQSKYAVMAKGVAAGTNLALTLLAVYLEADILWFAALYALPNLVLALGLVGFYGARSLSVLDWRYAHALAGSLVRESWPLMLSFGVISLYANVDKVIIQQLLGSSATGEYAVASRLSEVCYFLPTIIVGSLFPAMVNAKARSHDHYYERLQNLYDLMVWLSVAVAVPVALLANWIVDLFYGSQYQQAGDVLAIHIWASLFVFVGIASGRWLIIEGYVMTYFMRSLAGTVINIAANFYLIPIHGIKGAALATIIAQFFVVVVFDALSRDTRISFRMKIRAYLPLHLLQKPRSH